MKVGIEMARDTTRVQRASFPVSHANNSDTSRAFPECNPSAGIGAGNAIENVIDGNFPHPFMPLRTELCPAILSDESAKTTHSVRQLMCAVGSGDLAVVRTILRKTTDVARDWR